MFGVRMSMMLIIFRCELILGGWGILIFFFFLFSGGKWKNIKIFKKIFGKLCF